MMEELLVMMRLNMVVQFEGFFVQVVHLDHHHFLNIVVSIHDDVLRFE